MTSQPGTSQQRIGTFTLRQAFVGITVVAILLGLVRFAFTAPTTSAAVPLVIFSRAMLVLLFCPPWIPLLWLLRREARRLDDHRA